MEKDRQTMPSQFPAFRLMVARQMEAYRERIARRIREEAARHGESAPDLAHALGVYPSTAERWFRAERTPQHRHRRQLAEHWGLPFEELEPDLAAEEKKLRAQLDRIETRLSVVSELLARLLEAVAPEQAERAADELRRAEGEGQPESAESQDAGGSSG
jgi:transcriptional regulator with XRE-family HTH domain